jgi:hypothetical protein
MRLIVLCIILALTGNAYAEGGHKISRPVNEIKTEDDVSVSKLILNFENDSYAYQQTEYAAPMLTYYNTNGWSVGLASQNIVMSASVPAGSSTAQNFINDTFLNVSKTIHCADLLKSVNSQLAKQLGFVSTTFGSETGTVFPMSSSVQPNSINHKTLHEFYYVDTDLELIHNLFSVHTGPYWSNAALTNTTSYTGFEIGTEIVLAPKLIRLNIDLISGHSNVSGTVFQGTYSFNPYFEFFSGYGLAASNSGNCDYWLLGFNAIALLK